MRTVAYAIVVLGLCGMLGIANAASAQDKSAAFTPEELNYLAKHPLVTSEKTTGNETYGSTDAGTIKAAQAVKRISHAAKVLFYRNAVVHYGGYSFDKPLGPPQGPAEKRGYQHTREFAQASVWLDIEAGKGKVTWK